VVALNPGTSKQSIIISFEQELALVKRAQTELAGMEPEVETLEFIQYSKGLNDIIATWPYLDEYLVETLEKLS